MRPENVDGRAAEGRVLPAAVRRATLSIERPRRDTLFISHSGNRAADASAPQDEHPTLRASCSGLPELHTVCHHVCPAGKNRDSPCERLGRMRIPRGAHSRLQVPGRPVLTGRWEHYARGARRSLQGLAGSCPRQNIASVELDIQIWNMKGHLQVQVHRTEVLSRASAG